MPQRISRHVYPRLKKISKQQKDQRSREGNSGREEVGKGEVLGTELEQIIFHACMSK